MPKIYKWVKKGKIDDLSFFLMDKKIISDSLGEATIKNLKIIVATRK